MKFSSSFQEVLALLTAALLLPCIAGLSSTSSSSLSTTKTTEKLPTTAINITFHQDDKSVRHAVDKNYVDETTSSSILRSLVADSLTASHDFFPRSDSSRVETSDVISLAMSPQSSPTASVEPSSSTNISQMRTISLVPTSSNDDLSFADAVTESFSSIVDTVVGFVSSINEDPILDAVSDTLSNISELISEDPTVDFVTDAFSDFADMLGPEVGDAADTIINITDVILEFGSNVLNDNNSTVVDTVADTILSISEIVFDFLSSTTFLGVVSVGVAGILGLFVVAVFGGLIALLLILLI